MHTSQLSPTLVTLFGELINGAATTGAFVLNQGDRGLLSSLDNLSAEEASANSHGGATIAAHTAHVRYGLSLMNRWAGGEENPFASADWSKAWETTTVTEAAWIGLRGELREECELWLTNLGHPREVMDIELNGIVASVVHLGYHMGAMRQIAAKMRGPKAAVTEATSS